MLPKIFLRPWIRDRSALNEHMLDVSKIGERQFWMGDPSEACRSFLGIGPLSTHLNTLLLANIPVRQVAFSYHPSPSYPSPNSRSAIIKT